MTEEATSAHDDDDVGTSSEEAELSHSDTSDDAMDVSELLAVGDPVYFNYSETTPTLAPASLKVRSMLAIIILTCTHHDNFNRTQELTSALKGS